MEHWWTGNWQVKATWKEKKLAPLLHLPKCYAYYSCDRTWASVVRRWQLTTWTTHSFTDSLTHALPPSCEVNSCSGVKKFQILYKIHIVQYHVHKNLSLIPILSEMNPLHTLPFNCYNSHFTLTFHRCLGWLTAWAANTLTSNKKKMYILFIKCKNMKPISKPLSLRINKNSRVCLPTNLLHSAQMILQFHLCECFRVKFWVVTNFLKMLRISKVCHTLNILPRDSIHSVLLQSS